MKREASSEPVVLLRAAARWEKVTTKDGITVWRRDASAIRTVRPLLRATVAGARSLLHRDHALTRASARRGDTQRAWARPRSPGQSNFYVCALWA